MSQIPTLDFQVRPEAAPNFQQRPLENTFAQSVGAGLSNVGEAVAQIQHQERLKADRAAFMDADRQTDTFANDLLTKSQSLQGKDAIGSSPQLLSEFDKQASATGAKLTSRRAFDTYMESVNSRRSSLQRALDSHEGQQREAYYAKANDDFKDQAHINAVANYRDPTAIEGEVEKVRAAVEQTPGLDDAQKSTEFGIRRAGMYAGVIDRFLANDQVGAARKYYESIKDDATAKAAYIENRINDSAKALEVRAKSQAAEIRAGRILSIYSSDGPDAGAHALETLSKEGHLTQEQLGDVQSKVLQGLNLARNANAEVHADDLASLRQNIANGSSGLEDAEKVESLWKANALTPTERATMVGQLERNHIEKKGMQAAAMAFDDAMHGGIPLSPSNPDHKKVLDASFSAATAGVDVGSPQFQQLASAYAARTRMVPSQATQWAQGAIRSPNPQTAAAGAQFLGAVEAAAPDAVSGFDTDTKAFAGVVNQMIDAGTQPEEAIATARANVFDVKPPIVEARKKAYDSGKNALALGSNGALDSYIDRDFDKSWFSAQPEASSEYLTMRYDFNGLAEKYYLKTGDINVARDNAWRDVKRAYGPSTVNGHAQMMLMPPEKFGVKPQEIRTDIGTFLNANPQADGTTADDVVIVPDSQTMRSVNDIVEGKAATPSYKMVGKSGDLIADSKGLPHRYYLPGGEELAARIREAQKKATDLAEKQVTEARAVRAASQSAATDLISSTGGLH